MKNLREFISERQMGGFWKTIKKDGMTATFLYFDQPSEWGIEEGKISKLEIRDRNNKIVCNYDRGWDVEPREEAKKFYDEIIKKYN